MYRVIGNEDTISINYVRYRTIKSKQINFLLNFLLKGGNQRTFKWAENGGLA